MTTNTKINFALKDVAEAADGQNTGAFLATLCYVTLNFNGYDVSPMRATALQWKVVAETFLTEAPVELRKAFVSLFNISSLTPSGDCDPDKMFALGKILKSPAVKEFLEREISVPPVHQNLFRAFAAHLIAVDDSKIESTWLKINNVISILKQPLLNAACLTVADLDTPSAKLPAGFAKTVAQLQALVQGLTARSGDCFLTMRESADLRTTDPEKLSTYSKLVKIVKTTVDPVIKQAILSSGQPSVSIDELHALMTSKKMPSNLPVGFVGGRLGVVSNKLVAFTAENRQLGQLPTGRVMMNPAYDPATNKTYVCSGGGVRYRTLSMGSSNTSNKFDKVVEYRAEPEKYRARWLKDLMSFDPDTNTGRPSKEVVLACMVELLHGTHQRIGGKDNATAGKQTFGLSTLTVGHLKITPTTVAYSYSGKKSADQYTVFKTTGSKEAVKVGQVIRALVESRTENNKILAAKALTDPLFTYRTAGKDKPVMASAVRDYMGPSSKNGKTVGGIDLPITPHGFRHALATQMMEQIISKSKFKKGKVTQKELNAWLLEETKAIGKVLHHSGTDGGSTGKTAFKSYIDDRVVKEFCTKLGLRLPKFVPGGAG